MFTQKCELLYMARQTTNHEETKEKGNKRRRLQIRHI
jgi:hypothetical protein